MIEPDTATQDTDVHKTAPLPAQQKANLTTLFADGLEDIRNDVYAVQVQLSFLTNQVVRATQASRIVMWAMAFMVVILLVVALLLGYIIGRVR